MSEGHDNNSFLVVGIGGSAGALEALEAFFSHVPADSGLAYLVVQHLSPDYKSLMVELLSRHAKVPVAQATDGMTVEPNHVYLIPPGYNMTFGDYRLHLTDRPPKSTLNLPVDLLFNSLAEALKEKAIGIILSGTGSDGTRGVRRIKEHGGTIFVQDTESASFDGMPRNAAATQLVDFVLPPDEMPQKLLDFVNHPFLASESGEQLQQSQDEDALEKIFTILRQHGSVDFTYYKQTTMLRRIERRMSINQITRLYDYLVFMYQSPLEVQTLFKDLLIGVTQFFRDPDAFDVLNNQVIPEILQEKGNDEQVRIWVAGCSTGEEAYSIAIMIREQMQQLKQYPDVKIFATDIDKDALDFAARGVYPESIAADVLPKRLQDFFIKRGDRFEIHRQIRDMVIFARQDLTKDPPFSRIDLISCRNVLIYLQPILQKRVLTNFEFALNNKGHLLLGSSETTGDGFESLISRDHRWKVFQFSGLKARMSPMASSRIGTRAPSRVSSLPATSIVGGRTSRRAADTMLRRLLDTLAAPCLIVDLNQNLLHSFGEIKPYLVPPSGYGISLDVLQMVPAELSIALATALHKTLKEDCEVVYENVTFVNAGQSSTVNLRTIPFALDGEMTDSILIVLDPLRSVAETENDEQAVFDLSETSNQRIRDLETELQHTRENMQALVEELETSNEELQATNEELLAANEELQSTNEELQAVNEELLTVNGEYQAKIRELVEMNDDMDNLFRNTSVGTLFLDNDLRVRKFTPLAQTEFNLLEQDIGRAFHHLTHNFSSLDIYGMARNVIDTLQIAEIEARSTRGLWYLLKIIPFRTSKNVVNGAIITMIDVTKAKQKADELQFIQAEVQAFGTTLYDGVMIVAGDEIQVTNQAFATLLQLERAPELIGTSFVALCNESVQPDFELTAFDKKMLALRNPASQETIWVEGHCEAVTLDGRPAYLLVVRPVQTEQLGVARQPRYRVLLLGDDEGQRRLIAEGMLPAVLPGIRTEISDLADFLAATAGPDFGWIDDLALDLIIASDIDASEGARIAQAVQTDEQLSDVPLLLLQRGRITKDDSEQVGYLPVQDLSMHDFRTGVRRFLL